ncbi:MAG TPA: 3-dehydroquinate synthase [Acidobacteriota bacterium]|nr:3-dehydroquinate synthase [Acidobacteriota bacterium]
MKRLNIELKDHRYPIVVGSGIIGKAGAELSGIGFDSAPIVITTARIHAMHGSPLMKSLHEVFGPVRTVMIGDGERYKSQATLARIYDGMFKARADRSSWILAFGGGVVGDIAGFAAATFMRGIPFVMIPTTLLSQVDSSIGGKTAINTPHGKNLIGAFHQPSAVLSDTEVLKTLPGRELASGLYEVIKCGAIRSVSLLGYIERNLHAILECRQAEMEHIITAAARIKADIVAMDEKETGLRMMLNYGHTMGHAFEAAGGYRRFNHGEAVAWGMIAALGYAREAGMLRQEESERLLRLICRVGKLPFFKGISINSVWNALKRDKKFKAGDIRMVFLKRLGDAVIVNGIDAADLRSYLKRFLSGGGMVDQLFFDSDADGRSG